MLVDLYLRTQARQEQREQIFLEVTICINIISKIWFRSLVGIGAVLRMLVCSVAISTLTVRLATILMGFELVPISHKIIEKILFLFYFSSNVDVKSVKKNLKTRSINATFQI